MLIIDPKKRATVKDVLDILKERLPLEPNMLAYVVDEQGEYARDPEYSFIGSMVYPWNSKKHKIPIEIVIGLLLEHLEVELHTREINGERSVWLGERYDPKD